MAVVTARKPATQLSRVVQRYIVHCRATYATRASKPKAQQSSKPRTTKQDRPPAVSTTQSQKAAPSRNGVPTIPARSPPPLAHEARQAGRPKPEDGDGKIERWKTRQQLGYKATARKILQLMVGIPVVIVFGGHLYGRLFLGWEQKEVRYREMEDGRVLLEPIPGITRDFYRPEDKEKE